MDQTPVGPTDRPFAVFAPVADHASDQRIEVRTPTAHIGQGPQNDVVVDDDTVSSRHARLEFSDGTWRLTDLDSRNGTYVEGVRLAAGVPTPLLDSAAVAFGAVQLRFSSTEGADPEVAAGQRTARVDKPPAVRPAGFRLPVWLVVLVVLFTALLVFLFIWFGGEPATVSLQQLPGSIGPSATSSLAGTAWPRMAA